MTIARQVSRGQVATVAGLAAPLVLTAVLIPFRGSLPNTDAALALVLVVVAVAAAGRRPAGVLAAVSAGVWFDFFLTVPYERLTITRRPDIETTVLILAVGIAVTEIAVRGRRHHAAAARRAGYLDGIGAAARAVAAGTDPQQLIGQVCDQLTRLLGLSACRFQDGAAGSAARPGCCPTAASTSPGRPGTPNSPGCRPAGTPSCWPRPAAC
jgi:K+-sensing histidine kinase KdpD